MTFLEPPYTQIHPEGAVNVQVYRLIKEWTAWDIARRAAFAFFGIFQGTEENPEFLNGISSLCPYVEPVCLSFHISAKRLVGLAVVTQNLMGKKFELLKMQFCFWGRGKV